MKAVPLALVASLLLLWIYRRAVKRSMGRRAGAGEGPLPSEDIRPAGAAPAAPLQFVTAEDASVPGTAAAKLEARGLAGPWRNAVIYCVAGLGYVLTLTRLRYLMPAAWSSSPSASCSLPRPTRGRSC